MIWSQFESEHGLTSPNAKKSVAHRKNNLQVTLENIIAHNQNKSHSYQKGLNQYSDMSE
jgi:hypothetical protein